MKVSEVNERADADVARSAVAERKRVLIVDLILVGIDRKSVVYSYGKRDDVVKSECVRWRREVVEVAARRRRFLGRTRLETSVRATLRQREVFAQFPDVFRRRDGRLRSSCNLSRN